MRSLGSCLLLLSSAVLTQVSLAQSPPPPSTTLPATLNCTNQGTTASNCTLCNNTLLDIKSNCTLCRERRLDPADGCRSCVNKLLKANVGSIYTCTECLASALLDPYTNCTTCFSSTRDPKKNCTACRYPWLDLSRGCDVCSLSSRLSVTSSCTECTNTRYTAASNCTRCAFGEGFSTETCSYCYDAYARPESNCTRCYRSNYIASGTLSAVRYPCRRCTFGNCDPYDGDCCTATLAGVVVGSVVGGCLLITWLVCACRSGSRTANTRPPVTVDANSAVMDDAETASRSSSGRKVIVKAAAARSPLDSGPSDSSPSIASPSTSSTFYTVATCFLDDPQDTWSRKPIVVVPGGREPPVVSRCSQCRSQECHVRLMPCGHSDLCVRCVQAQRTRNGASNRSSEAGSGTVTCPECGETADQCVVYLMREITRGGRLFVRAL